LIQYLLLAIQLELTEHMSKKYTTSKTKKPLDIYHK
jgi:hypothetical protein